MIKLKFTPHKKALIDGAFNKALFAMREQVLTDCNYYVRQQEGTLRASGRTFVDGTTMEVIYDTPYAKKVYYTGTPSTAVNPNASLQWCEKAKDTRGLVWGMQLGKAFAQNLRTATGATGRLKTHIHMIK